LAAGSLYLPIYSGDPAIRFAAYPSRNAPYRGNFQCRTAVNRLSRMRWAQ